MPNVDVGCRYLVRTFESASEELMISIYEYNVDIIVVRSVQRIVIIIIYLERHLEIGAKLG